MIHRIHLIKLIPMICLVHLCSGDKSYFVIKAKDVKEVKEVKKRDCSCRVPDVARELLERLLSENMLSQNIFCNY